MPTSNFYIRNLDVQQNVHTSTTKIMKTLFFKEWSHNIYSMF